MRKTAFAPLLLAVLTACPLAILGGPSGPKNCPNGVDYGDAGTCCPDGFSVNDYGKCEATPAPVETQWAARRAPDAGRDAAR
jgi:hypothetical protein